MKEWIRLHQVDADLQGEAPLRRCSVSIAESEILLLLGRRNSGTRLFYEILTGQAEIRRGKLFLEETRHRGSHFKGCPILGVDEDTALTQVLSLEANLRSLGGRERQKTAAEVRTMAAELGIRAELTAETQRVSARDQLLCWFLIAVLRDVRLMCLYAAGMSLGEEDRRAIFHAAKYLKTQGISTLILDEQLPVRTEDIDRICWMREGRIIKEFYPPFETLTPYPDREAAETVESHHSSENRTDAHRVERLQEYPEHRECLYLDYGDARISLREGEILGIYDENWPMGETLPGYLHRYVSSGDRRLQEAAYIPYDSQEFLAEHQSIGWNLMLTASRVTGTRFGIVQGHMERFLAREFCRRFHLDPEITIPEMTPGQKKLLCLYRIFWLHPGLILLESPLTPCETEEKRQAAAYIRELAAGGAAVILAFRSPEEWESFW